MDIENSIFVFIMKRNNKGLNILLMQLNDYHVNLLI